jgi:hypothetical protein
MDHIRILKRAFEITRRYRALWIFGILLALTTGGNSGNAGSQASGSGSDFGGNGGQFPWPRDWDRFTPPSVPWNFMDTVMPILIGVLCVVVGLIVLFTVLRFVAGTAAIRMVDRFEATGEKVSVREGFRLGWSRGAFRSWWASFVMGLVAFLVIILMLLVAAAPLLLWATQNETAGIAGTIFTVGLGILAVILIIILAVALGLWTELAHRAIVLENLGAIDGLRRGWALLRRRLGDVIILGLLLFAVSIGFALLMIPVALLLVLAGAVIGGLPGLLAGAITTIFADGALPRIIGLAVGVPIFLLVLSLPLLFFSGLYQIFGSSSWTLAFRDIVAREGALPVAPVEPQAPLAAGEL